VPKASPGTVRVPKDSEIGRALLFRCNISNFKGHQVMSACFGGRFYSNYRRLVNDQVAYIDGDDVVALEDYALAARDAFVCRNEESARTKTLT
jgi:hypothetical protein